MPLFAKPFLRRLGRGEIVVKECRLRSKDSIRSDGTFVVAIVTDTEMFETVRQAWRVSTGTPGFAPENPAQVVCTNEGFGASEDAGGDQA